jgi:hypothetical protein
LAKIKSILIACVLGGTAYGLYCWLSPGSPPSVGNEQRATSGAATPTAATPYEAKTIVGMARFLEAANPEQLKKIGLDPGQKKSEASLYETLLPFAHGARNGSMVAQLLSPSRGQGLSPEEARRDLLNNAAESVSDIQAVLSELPEHFSDERVTLLQFLGEASHSLENTRTVPEILIRESQKNYSPRDPQDSSPIPQVVALKILFDLDSDRTHRLRAYQTALDGQSDPTVKMALQRFEPMTRFGESGGDSGKLTPAQTSAPEPAVTPENSERDRPDAHEPPAADPAPTSGEPDSSGH